MSLTPPHQKEDRVGSRMLEGKTDHMGGVGIQGRAHEHVLPSRQPSSPFSPKSSLVVRADGLHTPRVEHRRPADRQRVLGLPGRWQDHRHQWHLGPALRSLGTCQLKESLWKWLFLLGLVLAALINLLLNGSFAFPAAMPFSAPRYFLGGLCIGLGTRLGRGCTSGRKREPREP